MHVKLGLTCSEILKSSEVTLLKSDENKVSLNAKVFL